MTRQSPAERGCTVPRQPRQLWNVFARAQEDLDRTGRAAWVSLRPARCVIEDEVDGAEETCQTISIQRGPEPEIVAGELVDDKVAALAP